MARLNAPPASGVARPRRARRRRSRRRCHDRGPRPQDQPPMKELLDTYVRYLVAEGHLSRNTLRNYRSDLLEWGRYLEGTLAVDPLQIDRHTFRSYLAHLRNKGVTNASIIRIVSTVRGFYRFLVREGRLS